MQSILNYLKNPCVFFDSLVLHCGQWLSDSLYLKLRYRFQMGERLNLKEPKKFSEKLQWLKLYDHNPQYTQMVDKIAAKNYVANILGSEYIVPLLGVWESPTDIDWDDLPNQFVLKTNHSGGNTGVIICKDKSKLDFKEAINKMTISLKNDAYYSYREWPYKNVKRKVFAEQYLEPKQNSGDLPDYKFFCFNGEPKFCQVISGRGTRMSIDFFDYDWNHQPFHEPKNYPFAEEQPQKPKKFEIMWEAAKKLSKDIAFSRIDFYDVDDKVYFGEITFYPTSGMGGFNPSNYDEIIGAMINLPSNR